MIEIALFQPDIAPNTAAILRLGACLGISVHIIEPAGFVWSGASFRRAGMDYVDQVRIIRQASFAHFLRDAVLRRVVLLSTGAQQGYCDFSYRGDDILLFGRESSGVPGDVRASADVCLTIPMQPGMRSLNVAMSAALVAGEALRQTREL